MAKPKIVWFPDCHLDEIYQSTRMKFAFCSGPNDGWRQCHPFVECRDFLQDAVSAHLNTSSASIYSFNYKSGLNPPIDMGRMRMLVTRKKIKKDHVQAMDKQLRRAIKMLHMFEERAGIMRSKILRVEDPECGTASNIWLFTGSAIWMKSPFFISMYTLIIRISNFITSDFETVEELNSSLKTFSKTSASELDASHTGSCVGKMDKVLTDRWKILVRKNGVDEAFLSGYTVRDIHNKCGIVSLCNGVTPNDKLNNKIKELYYDQEEVD